MRKFGTIALALFLCSCKGFKPLESASNASLSSRGQSCDSSETLFNGACFSTTQTCSITNGAGQQTFSNGNYGACVGTSCSPNYSLYNGACFANTQTCSIPNGTGQQTFSNGNYGACVGTSCSPNYSLYNGACFATTQTCSIANGTGQQTFSNGNYGACVATNCNSSYTLINGVCVVSSLEDRDQSAQYIKKNENFDQAPAWIGQNNRSIFAENQCRSVNQDYGYSTTNRAGAGAGEIGGHFARSVIAGYYADSLGGTVTFQNRLVASGSFLMTGIDDGSFHLGWFNSQMQGWRPVNQIGWRLDGRSAGYANVRMDYMTSTWNAGGKDTAINIHPDSTRHTFEMIYDPDGNTGGGTLTLVIDGGNPDIMNLDPGHKAMGAQMDRFGIFHNQRQQGSTIDVYFDDLSYTVAGGGTRSNSFSSDPQWEARGNRISFEDCAQRDNNTFGYSQTNYSGASRGEAGGLFWRNTESIDRQFSYADSVSNLGPNDYLEASGMISFVRGSADSGVLLGFFDENTQVGQVSRNSFIGVHIEGPSSIGHYFAGTLSTPNMTCGEVCRSGPVIRPNGERLPWKFIYNPNSYNGAGGIEVTLNGQRHLYQIPAGFKSSGATFTRFGLLGLRSSGNSMIAYIDDLQYTHSRGSGGASERSLSAMSSSADYNNFISSGQWLPIPRSAWDGSGSDSGDSGNDSGDSGNDSGSRTESEPVCETDGPDGLNQWIESALSQGRQGCRIELYCTNCCGDENRYNGYSAVCSN